MNKAILILGAGAAVFLAMKAGKAQAQPAMTVAQKQAQGLIPKTGITANVVSDMWTRLNGVGWTGLLNGTNADGSRKFTINDWGQPVTSDGKPIGSGDPIADYVSETTGLPEISTPYTDALFPLTANPIGGFLGWDN